MKQIDHTSWCKGMLAVGLLALLSGCEVNHAEAVKTTPATGPAENLGLDFDPNAAGKIVGQVCWDGPIPVVDRIERLPKPLESPPFDQAFVKDNPNAPRIDPESRGLADAVVYLRDVPLARSRPWNHERVSIEQRDQQIHVRQGQVDSRVGFVRRGTPVSMVSRDAVPHTLRLDGPRLLTLPFPDPDSPLTRSLDRPGLVELSSGMGFFWMRGYLFVDDHPYYARTDARGNFVLDQVPAGSYELVAWHPNWRGAGHERNPDSAQIIRLRFTAPLTQTKQATVEAARTTRVELTLSSKPGPDEPGR